MTFYDDFRRGLVSAEEIHDHVAAWHNAPIGSEAAKVDLHEYLGLTWAQYVDWASKGNLPHPPLDTGPSARQAGCNTPT